MAKTTKKQETLDDRDIAVRNKAKADLEKMLESRRTEVIAEVLNEIADDDTDDV